jgi:hypothetical protein
MQWLSLVDERFTTDGFSGRMTSQSGSPGKLAKWVRLSVVRKKIAPAKSLLENVLNYQKIFLN